MSDSSYISIYHSDVSLKMHKEAVNKALSTFKELHSNEPEKVRIAEHLANYLSQKNKFFAFINHNYDNIEQEIETVYEFAKILAYAYNSWAFIVFSSSAEGYEKQALLSTEYGIIELKKDESFAKKMEYLYTKAEYLKAKHKLEELEQGELE